MNEAEKTVLLKRIGVRVRILRGKLTVRELAERAQLSLRFLTQLEAGQGNISIAGLARVAAALNRLLTELIPPAADDSLIRAQVWRWFDEATEAQLQEFQEWAAQRRDAPQKQFIALVGLRGAGKSSIGKLLAERLDMEFVELDALIEEAAGMSLGEIFSMHGEAYYRRLELQALGRVFNQSAGCVLATGGSLVTDAESWAMVKRRARTVWLKAKPEDHMNRVLRQGDTRPMRDNPQAMTELRALLRRRDPLYAEAHATIQTSGKSINEILAEVVQAVEEKAGKND